MKVLSFVGSDRDFAEVRDALAGVELRRLPGGGSSVSAQSARIAVEVLAVGRQMETLLPVVVTCRGTTVVAGSTSAFIASDEGVEVAYALSFMEDVSHFACLDELRAHVDRAKADAVAQREATAGRWSSRAAGWQGVIDDTTSYVNHEDGYARFNAILKNVLQSVDAPSCVDVGCGTGDVARLMGSLGASDVLGIDNSAGMIEEASRIATKNIRYRAVGLEDIESGTEFDVIASRGVVLSHVPRQDVFDHLRQLTRLSREGSYLVLDFIQQLANGGFANAGDKNEFSTEWVREVMRELGWVPVAQSGDASARVVVAAFHRPFPDSVYFVTGNPVKLLELRHAASVPHLHGCDFDMPELKHESIERIAEDKARQAYAIVGRPVLCTDGGIFMHAYPGFPGPNSKQAATILKPDGLLRLLADGRDRSGSRMNAVAYYDGLTMRVATQSVAVRFAEESRGSYPSYPMDKVLIPEVSGNEEGLTYAEMPPEKRGRYTELAALVESVRGMLGRAG